MKELKEVAFNAMPSNQRQLIKANEILRRIEMLLLEWDSRNDKIMRITEWVDFENEEITGESLMVELDLFLNKNIFS